MSEAALAPTPAQARMAAARAARHTAKVAVLAEDANALDPQLIAQARRQKAEREEAERQDALRQAAEVARQEGRRMPPVGPSARERGAEAARLEELAKYDRAREMAEAQPEQGVRCRITKIGHNKVHKGVHVAGIGDVYYAWKDEPLLPESTATLLEDRGLVEILDA